MRKKNQEPFGFTVSGIIGMAGGAGEVARACGISVQSVAKWSRRVPSIHARTVAVRAGLPLEIVRPDMVQAAYSKE